MANAINRTDCKLYAFNELAMRNPVIVKDVLIASTEASVVVPNRNLVNTKLSTIDSYYSATLLGKYPLLTIDSSILFPFITIIDYRIEYQPNTGNGGSMVFFCYGANCVYIGDYFKYSR
jgi:hypothetical protein